MADDKRKSEWGKSVNPAYNQAVDVGYEAGQTYVERGIGAGGPLGVEALLYLSNIVSSAVVFFDEARRAHKFSPTPKESKQTREFGIAQGFGDGFVQGVVHAVGIKNPNYEWNRKLLGWTLSESVAIDTPPEDSDTQS